MQRLLRQSKELENEKFELTFTWDKEDEINILGRSFEKARRSIINLIEELKTKNKQLEKLYITDQLTSLYNRYKLDDALSAYSGDSGHRLRFNRTPTIPSFSLTLFLPYLSGLCQFSH